MPVREEEEETSCKIKNHAAERCKKNQKVIRY